MKLSLLVSEARINVDFLKKGLGISIILKRGFKRKIIESVSGGTFRGRQSA